MSRRVLNRSVLLFVAAASAWIFSAACRHSHAPGVMAYFADDFYYYAVIARNIHAGLGSTFDGVVPTNGYHPLYTLLLVPFTDGASLTRILLLLFVLMFGGALLAFVCARTVMERAGFNAVWANACALFALYLPFRMFFQGMEVTLTIPLELAWMCAMLLLWERGRVSAAAAAGAGLLAAAMVFSRLDSGLFVVLLCVCLLAFRETRAKLSLISAAAFACALGLPVLGYLAFNRTHFGVWMPISGMAKQLRNTHAPSMLALGSMWHGANAKLLVAMVAVGAVLWVWQRRKLSAAMRALTLAAIVFPVVHVLLLSVLSDWQMWGWYHYSFVPATVACMVLARSAVRSLSLPRPPVLAWALLALAAVAAATNHWRVDPEMEQIAQTARQLQPFLAAHPGRYAMGDRAGMVAWLSPQPFFQTEGLVEDRAWLKTLEQQGDLVTALKTRGVRYYITTDWLTGDHAQAADAAPSGCTRAVEPAQAGPSGPHLVSVLCSAPVAAYMSPGPSAKQTLVFDLER